MTTTIGFTPCSVNDYVFARQDVENGDKKRRREMMSDCVFDREERRKEMNGFDSVQLKHNGGEEGRWRWRCREYKASMEM